MKPFISIIIPVYNAEKYLPRTLESVLGQTFSATEIIVIDDGSTDGSCALIEEFALRDSRIQLLRQEHQNAGVARNRGLEVARGEYLSFLDADDFYEPEMLERAYQKAVNDNCDIVVYGSDEYYEETGEYKTITNAIRYDLIPEVYPFSSESIEKDVFHAFVGWPWDKLFNARFIKETGLTFQSLRSSNDALFVYMAIIKAERITVLNEVLAHHSKRNTSLSCTREQSWECFFHALIAMRDQMEQWGVFAEREKDYINYSLNFSLWHLNTLKGKAFRKLYNKLKTQWFAELGVTGQEESFWYNYWDYLNLQEIMQMDADEYQFHRINSANLRLEKSIQEIGTLQGEIGTLQGEIGTLQGEIGTLQGEIGTLQGEIGTLQGEKEILLREKEVLQKSNASWKIKANKEEKEKDCLLNSRSYRLGRVMTSPYRKIKQVLKTKNRNNLVVW